LVPGNEMTLFTELKRRNVLRAGAAYVVAAWLLIQVAETIFPLFGLGDKPARIVVIVLAVGFIPSMVVAWAFELTPGGLKKERDVDRADAPRSYKNLDRLIMLGLALALGYFAFDRFVLAPHREASVAAEARQEGRAEALVESYGGASIAVLAFENLSPDSEQEFFADGISEEILNLLATIPELRVISRSSAFTYKGRKVPIPQIARELNVAHVLEGSVRKAGNRIRITAQLIEARSDTHLWSGTWDRTLDDVFAIQDEIATDVVSQLQVSLVGELPTSWRTNPEVYALTMQGKQLIEGAQAKAELPRIIDLLARALSIDPNYVPALAAKIRGERLMTINGLMSREEFDQLWRGARSRILALDPDNSVVASLDAWNLYEIQRDIEAAAAIYESLIANHPNDAEVLRLAGRFLRRIGLFDQSIAVLKRCLLVDPLKHACTWELKEAYLWSGQLEQSRIYADRLNTMYGRTAGSNDVYRLLLEGRPAEARDLAQTLKDSFMGKVLLALAAYDLGDKEALERYREEVLASDPDNSADAIGLSAIAGMHAYVGDLDLAFAYLAKATTADEIHTYRELLNPWYGPLHQDSRWTAYRQRLGLSEARLAAIEFSVPESFLRAPQKFEGSVGGTVNSKRKSGEWRSCAKSKRLFPEVLDGLHKPLLSAQFRIFASISKFSAAISASGRTEN
jgi:adenylate cyclase